MRRLWMRWETRMGGHRLLQESIASGRAKQRCGASEKASPEASVCVGPQAELDAEEAEALRQAEQRRKQQPMSLEEKMAERMQALQR